MYLCYGDTFVPKLNITAQKLTSGAFVNCVVHKKWPLLAQRPVGDTYLGRNPKKCTAKISNYFGNFTICAKKLSCQVQNVMKKCGMPFQEH